MQSILVQDFMNQQPLVVRDTDDIRTVVSKLLEHKVIGAPVVDAQRRLVGFVSEQDCIKEMLNDAFYCEEPASVTKVMHREVLTVTPSTSIVEVAQTMLANKPKNYPVVEGDKLVGLVSRQHVLKALLANDDDCYLRKPA
ncbi:CBS domain-containing protein [Simiduia sp. 21SJ11W-1]|uniref:CBS domain-containing protein n=1 Tax=Simiduia sp. 21SJ11W-1 TaxID=2909669 RepID=UPI00209C997A|nr:CBS domain-containing protein [Simiduia sp. 21SJ11W-1]UTA49295.1 CBS domain-containing protein [Simiduia sp. 21SJ11W-1]